MRTEQEIQEKLDKAMELFGEYDSAVNELVKLAIRYALEWVLEK